MLFYIFILSITGGGGDSSIGMPSSIAEWAVFEPSEELKIAFVEDASLCAISRKTITCPELTIHYLTVSCSCIAIYRICCFCIGKSPESG